MRTLTLFAFILLVPSAIADQWAPPKTRAFASPNGRFVLRIVPGHIVISDKMPLPKSLKIPPDTEPARSTMAAVFELTQKADGYQKIWEFPLLNSWSPVDACISDSAEVYTFDDWGHMGDRFVVVCYSPEGKMKKEFTLNELIPDKPRAEIEESHRSVSSTWWRKDSGRYGAGMPYFDLEHNLVIIDALGGLVVITSADVITAKYYPAEKETK